ncbi:MAG: hypothetical protein A3H35_03835 [Betaproteobacteria bacterium RIFCSPLOWO2_02_FULL_62_17]|nr:MAG: hypothetical protein A3H35_03835 [Betaproteobacteria bacterium RIFCSPLOWO2_02_FULL_62_17]
MDATRWLRHVLAADWLLWRHFPKRVLAAIENSIGEQEQRHLGELRFAVEGGLSVGRLVRGQGARARAVELFGALRVWDTEQNSGVLIYLLLADRAVEILADRGIQAQVGNQKWEGICAQMRSRFAAGDFEGGSVEGILAVSDLLAQHFPASGENRNELPDKPIVL